MMVRIRYKTGSIRLVPGYVAKRLVERRIAEYYDGQEAVKAAVAAVPQAVQAAEGFPEPTVEPLDLDALTRDELYALAVERGLEPHHKTGEAKLRAMLQ